MEFNPTAPDKIKQQTTGIKIYTTTATQLSLILYKQLIPIVNCYQFH